MKHEEYQYLDLMSDILHHGDERIDRTKVGTKSLFGAQMRFDLSKNFPLLTTKRVWMKGVIHELLWFIKGDTNIKYLVDNGVHIWDAWADVNGDLGPVYGKQWRAWQADDGSVIDQLAQVISDLKTNPYSRRHIISAWNVAALPRMALAPCHCFLQFHVSNGKLNCQLYQRSCDWFLGVPFNIASYALLTMMIAQVTGLKPGSFIHTSGDLHLYVNHLTQVDEQLKRTPFEFPKLELNTDIKSIDDFKYEDVRLINYKCHPKIDAPIAI